MSVIDRFIFADQDVCFGIHQEQIYIGRGVFLYRFGKAVVKMRGLILAAALVLIIPSVLGIIGTRINYDMLTYLPEDIDTVKGQGILMDEFGKGAFTLIIAEGMSNKEVSGLRQKIEEVPHVADAVWYDSFADLGIPVEILPQQIRDIFIRGDETVIAVFFDTSSSADETIEAVGAIRSIAGKQCLISGISAMVTDLKNLCEREEPVYVGIAVLCALAAMELLTDAWLVPCVFLLGIGITILYNLGTNYFFGEISYITKALAAVLQLAVTMDYSIFLWNAYAARKNEEADHKEAMARAIADTVASVAGSSLTTIAGFLALCFMSYAMGRDIGLVMAKGALLGVAGSVTILPALILLFDGAITKTRHRPLLPDMSRLSEFITRHYPVFLILFAVLMVPAVIGYRNTPVYYDLTKVLAGGGEDEDAMPFYTANNKLKNDFHIATTHMVLCSAELPSADAAKMQQEIEELDGIENVLGMSTLVGSRIPDAVVPEKLEKTFKSGKYQLILINSSYGVATDECGEQIDGINRILKEYDPDGMVIGEAACTKDLIEITDRDFRTVSLISIVFVFVIILLTLRSVSLPVILVAVIEFAVFINLGIPYYTGNVLSFITPICISTIQLGSTVDYAILMTTKYREFRRTKEKTESIKTALAYALPSVITSALSFFAATIGVGIYSDVDLISSMCLLLARGALISMLAVLLVLPSLLILLDPLVEKTSLKSMRAGN